MKSRREQLDKPGSGHNPDHRHQRDDGQERREDRAGQFPCLLFAPRRPVFRVHGNEGRRHRTLGKQLAEEARDAERDEKGIGSRRRAEQSGQDHVADEAEDTAGKRGDADHPSCFND